MFDSYNPKECIKEYILRFRYYEPPKKIYVNGQPLIAKWRGTTDRYQAYHNSSSFKPGLYYLIGTGSCWGYFDGQKLHYEFYNLGTLQVPEPKDFTIRQAYWNNRPIAEPEV